MIHEIRLGIKAFSIDGKSLLAFSIILGNAGIKIVPSPKPIKINDIDTVTRPMLIFSFFEVFEKYFCDKVSEIG